MNGLAPAAVATPLRFADTFFPGFMAPPHVHAFQRASMALVFDPMVNRQIVEAPVRHGKSVWHSIIMPAWFCCTFPDRMVLGASYGSDLSDGFSRQVSRMVQRAAPYYGLKQDPRWTRRDSFRWLNAEGGYDSVGAGGAVSGKGYHFIAADDLVKDHQAARSPTQRKTLSDWFDADLLSRLEPGGKISLVMSRRHLADLSGECLEMNAELPEALHWHSIKFKAIGDDGAALWPQRYDLEWLADREREYELKGKSYMFAAEFQQNPRSDPSACAWPDDYFGPDLMYSALPPDLPVWKRILAVDPSCGSQSNTGDYCATARIVLTRESPRRLWVQMDLQRLTWSEVIEHSAAAILAWKPDAAIMEGAGFQGSLVGATQERLDAAGCFVPLHVFDPMQQSKEPRIKEALDEWLRLHRVRFCDTVGGRLTVRQLQEFPSGEHDDGPDALAMGLTLLVEMIG